VRINYFYFAASSETNILKGVFAQQEQTMPASVDGGLPQWPQPRKIQSKSGLIIQPCNPVQLI